MAWGKAHSANTGSLVAHSLGQHCQLTEGLNPVHDKDKVSLRQAGWIYTVPTAYQLFSQLTNVQVIYKIYFICLQLVFSLF